MRKIFVILMFLGTLTASAQSLGVDMSCSDSIMAVLQQKYDPYHILHTDSAKQQSSLVIRQYGLLKVNERAVRFPGVWVSDPPGIFEEQDERQWMLEDHTLGEEIFHGVLDVVSDILSARKNKKKR